MVDVGTALRAAFFSVLDGQLIIEGAEVPIVDEKLDVNITEQDVYVMMTTQDEETETRQNKTNFVNETILRMRVVNVRKATSTKEVVEDVAGQILEILYPTRVSSVLSLAAPLNLTYSKYTGGQYDPLARDDGGNFIISKTLTFKNRITQ